MPSAKHYTGLSKPIRIWLAKLKIVGMMSQKMSCLRFYLVEGLNKIAFEVILELLPAGG